MSEFPPEPVCAGAPDASVILDAGLTLANPRDLDLDKPQALIVPAGATLEIPDVDRFRDAPRRKHGRYRPATVDAFIAYGLKHASEESTTVWVHPTSGVVVAVFDDHDPLVPGWREHRSELRLTPTPEWLYWTGKDGEMMVQDAFAEHIEGGLEEIVDPAAAVMLEIAQSFHASTSAQFRSATRLASGEQRLQYDEEVKASAGSAGELTVPTELTLAVAPFIGEDAYRVKARLRFRVRAGSLTLGYRLDRPEAVVRDALEKVTFKIGGHFAQTYLGDPPA